MKSTWTSICSTLKQSGAHTERMTTIEKPVSMPTIGKTIDENPLYFSTLARCVRTGVPAGSSSHIKRDAQISISASSPTAGRSKSTTHHSLRPRNANMERIAKRVTVLTITLTMTEKMLCPSGSTTSLDLASKASLQTSMWVCTAASRTPWPISRPHFRACLLRSYAM